MAIRKQHKLTENIWFITFTCYNWLPLFEIADAYDLIYNWLKLIDKKHQIKTLAFVVMPNHVHLLLYLPRDDLNLNKIVSNAKRFMAYEFVKRLEEKKENALLFKLSSACTILEKAKGQKHKVFEPSFNAKAIYSLNFLYQKLNYIHHNPVSGKWQLSKEYTDYKHSSAAFYADGKPNDFLNITDYRNLRRALFERPCGDRNDEDDITYAEDLKAKLDIKTLLEKFKQESG